MDDLSGHLDGVDYPATKEQLIDAAVDGEAPQELIERLQSLSREQYENPGEVERELAESD